MRRAASRRRVASRWTLLAATSATSYPSCTYAYVREAAKGGCALPRKKPGWESRARRPFQQEAFRHSPIQFGHARNVASIQSAAFRQFEDRMHSPEPEGFARNALLTPPLHKHPVDVSAATPVGQSLPTATPTTDEMADRLLAELSGVKMSAHRPATRHAVHRAADEVKAALDFDDVTELSVAQALRLCPALAKQHMHQAEERQVLASLAARRQSAARRPCTPSCNIAPQSKRARADDVGRAAHAYVGARRRIGRAQEARGCARAPGAAGGSMAAARDEHVLVAPCTHRGDHSRRCALTRAPHARAQSDRHPRKQLDRRTDRQTDRHSRRQLDG
jgi:hypothetical protein